MGNHFNVDGFIAPGNNPEKVDRYRQLTDRTLWSPGFGRQDKQGRNLETQIEEWAQIVGPNSAMVVGSLIYGAKNPREAARKVREARDKVIERI